MEKSFKIRSLGDPQLHSPIALTGSGRYVSDEERMLYAPSLSTVRAAIDEDKEPISFEVAGPREFIYFFPQKTRAAIVTCGGLCPGLNVVIRSLVMQLWYRYDVRNILGIRYGYQGLGKTSGDRPILLTPDHVNNIHTMGGTILGSSRGTPSTEDMVDRLQELGVNVLFIIGGDGTMRGGAALVEEISKRSLDLAVVGIPKTIDNDIPYVRRSFGFESAVEVACDVVMAAHEEARGAKHGIGLVKLMGRQSGYIAANTTLATGHVNFCLVPEVGFDLKGPKGLLAALEKRFEHADHSLIVVAEGAGQSFFEDVDSGQDASGNKALKDIGSYLKREIVKHFQDKGQPVSLKYIDPSYVIRSAPANPADVLFCSRLAQNAVHAAMAGKTGMLIGYWHGRLTHVPFEALQGDRQSIHPEGELWFNVIETTGQPELA